MMSMINIMGEDLESFLLSERKPFKTSLGIP
jgi:hypothetical protein